MPLTTSPYPGKYKTTSTHRPVAGSYAPPRASGGSNIICSEAGDGYWGRGRSAGRLLYRGFEPWLFQCQRTILKSSLTGFVSCFSVGLPTLPAMYLASSTLLLLAFGAR